MAIVVGNDHCDWWASLYIVSGRVYSLATTIDRFTICSVELTELLPTTLTAYERLLSSQASIVALTNAVNV